MERIAVLAITKNGVEMGLSLKKLFPDWQIFAPSKFSDNNEMINWYDDSTSIKIVDLFQSNDGLICLCLLYTSPSPRDGLLSRMPSSA